MTDGAGTTPAALTSSSSPRSSVNAPSSVGTSRRHPLSREESGSADATSVTTSAAAGAAAPASPSPNIGRPSRQRSAVLQRMSSLAISFESELTSPRRTFPRHNSKDRAFHSSLGTPFFLSPLSSLSIFVGLLSSHQRRLQRTSLCLYVYRLT